MERLRAIQSKGQPWPIVIKPDEGQRGLGVRIVKSEEEAKETLGHLDESLVLQEFVDGPEYGVFYYRYPEAEKGVISSITIKQLTSVTGDGERSLEDLILADDRTVDPSYLFP